MNDFSASNISSTTVREVLRAAAISCICCFASSVAITIFAEFNALSPSLVWYPIPTVLVTCWVISRIETKEQLSRNLDFGLKLWAVVGLLALFAALISLTATGWGYVLNGTARLDGESRFPPSLFRASFPFVVNAAAGFVEEATIRGLFQLKVKKYVGTIRAQIAAGIMFVALHGTDALEPRRLLLFSVVALFSGLLTARTNSVLPAAIFHASSNVLSAITVRLFRP